MDKALYTYEEAAGLLSVSHWTVRRWVRQGRLRTAAKGLVTAGSIRRIGELDAEAQERDAHDAPGVQKQEAVCRTNGKARPTTGHRSSNQAARELDALLGRRT